MSLGSGACEAQFSFGTRFEDKAGTNPEELLGAALAGCFSMALAHELKQNEATPLSVETSAEVKIEKQGDGFAITHIQLNTQVEANGIDEAQLADLAQATKKACPVGNALSSVPSHLSATLKKG